jgi:aspartate/methionine/tyrosine aminotransferase
MPQFVKNDIISLVGDPPLHDLGESVGPDLLLGELLGGEDGSWKRTRLGYATAAGAPVLRAAIADLHGVAPEDVVVTVGGIHALFLLGYILCGRGEEAVIATPAFPPARDTLISVGARLRALPVWFDDRYQLDLDALVRLLSPETRLVSLASPQNPCGVAIPRAVLAEVISAMSVRCPDALLLLDETYRCAVYGDDALAPSAATMSPQVIVTGSLSKCHGVPGVRVGWAITRNAKLREQLVVGKFNTVISNSAVDEMVGLRVLRQAGEIVGARRQRLGEGLARTAVWVERNAALVEWVRPDAGALCCIRLRADVFDSAAVARFYTGLSGRNARVGNGGWFGEEPRVFRLGFGLLPPQELDAALDVLTETLHQARLKAA